MSVQSFQAHDLARGLKELARSRRDSIREIFHALRPFHVRTALADGVGRRDAALNGAQSSRPIRCGPKFAGIVCGDRVPPGGRIVSAYFVFALDLTRVVIVLFAPPKNGSRGWAPARRVDRLEGWPMGIHRSVSTEPAHPDIRVLPVADVRLYREGLANCLASRASLEVVGLAANRDEALALVASLQPDVVVLDMATRDSLAIVRAINGSTPAVRIIAFAIEPLDREILACAEAGVAGYVHSEASTDDLVAAIESVMRGELLCPPRTAALLLRRLALLAKTTPQPNTVNLTGREREIGLLIDDGLSNKEIAQRLNIEVATVKNHVHNILEKLHVPSRAQAAAHLRATLGHVSRSAAFDRLEQDPGAKV